MNSVTTLQRQCAVDAVVVDCIPICREHIALELAPPAFPDSTPGQFVQLLCRSATEPETEALAWPADGFPSLSAHFSAQEPLLRRPFSIADHWIDGTGQARLRVISRAVGAGTRWLAQLQAGDTLNLTGPLGRGFCLPSPETPVVLVGGGVGIPPLMYLARRLHDLGHRDVVAIFGATTRDLLPLRLTAEPPHAATPTVCAVLPGAAAFPAILTSDDGTLGLRGRVTDALAAWHARYADPRRPALVCACGPDAMLRAVADLTRAHGLACQLCIERPMGCGVGTCLSCVVRRADAEHAAGWRWALTCTDGPVFARDDLLDYGPVRSA